jgi:hypothetical protein
VKVGSIVQVLPMASNWAGCLVIVTEVRTWGVVGFTPVPPHGGMAFIRIENADLEDTGGMAVWTAGEASVWTAVDEG